MWRLALLTVVAVTCLIGQPRLISLDDQHRFQDVGDPQCAPDGKWIAYTLTTVDTKEDKRNTDIWMVSRDGKDQVRLTSSPEGENRPRFSPDGRWLAFLSGRPGKAKGTQVWLLDRKGGEAVQLTDVKGRLGGFEWSPDSKRLLLSMTLTDDPPAEEGKPPAKPKPIVIDRYAFKRDGAGYLTGPHRSKLWLFDIATKKLDALTKEAFEESNGQWSPDGKWIAFVSKRGDDADRNNNTEIWVAEAAAGATPRKLTSFPGPDNGPVWSPDSKWIAYVQGSDPKLSAYNMPKLALVSAEGGAPKLLTASLDRGVSSPVFTNDGSAIDFLVADDMNQYPARVSVNGGAVEKLAGGSRVAFGMDRAAACTVSVVSSDTAPGEIYAFENNTYRKLTSHNDALVAELKLGATEEIRFKTKDGTEVHGLMVKPPDYVAGQKYPSLLRIHGGPNGQDAHNFSFERQFFAANGYVVYHVNYRGSNGRGQDFQKAIFADWGGKEVIDLLAGVDHMVASGVADPERLGVGGWSYGGILTNALIASTTRFKSAISGAGSAFHVALYGVDQYVYQYDNEVGPPWKALDQWLKISYPFVHADRIKTPTMYVGGEKDFNVPIQGSEQMYQALKSLGVPTQLIIYPGEFHGISRPSFQRDRMERYLAWYDKYLKPAKPAPSGE